MASTIHIGASNDGPKNQVKRKLNPVRRGRSMNLIEKINDYLISFGKLKPAEKASFFRLLSTMIEAGISLVKSLHILIDQVDRPLMKKIIRQMVRDIESGGSFSEAVARHPKYFQPAEVGMLEAGEASGKLNKVLAEIAKQTEKAASFVSKIKSAMIYPIVIILIMIAAGFAVMTLVIPKIKDLFEGLGGDLPPVTQVLISMSDFLVSSNFGLPNALWIITILLLLSALLIWLKRHFRSFAYLWARMVFNLPIFGKLSKKSSLARFCRTLSTLVSSGIPILKALSITSSSIGNVIYEDRIKQIAEDVKHGISMAENMKGDKKYFPSMVVGMIGVAEQTAQLDKITDRLANHYEEEVDEMVKGFSSIIEPLIIVVLGTSVGVLVVAVMQPILTITDFAF